MNQFIRVNICVTGSISSHNSLQDFYHFHTIHRRDGHKVLKRKQSPSARQRFHHETVSRQSQAAAENTASERDWKVLEFLVWKYLVSFPRPNRRTSCSTMIHLRLRAHSGQKNQKESSCNVWRTKHHGLITKWILINDIFRKNICFEKMQNSFDFGGNSLLWGTEMCFKAPKNTFTSILFLFFIVYRF